MKLTHTLLAAGIAVIGVTAGTAFAQSSDTLRFGIEAAYPPFESKTPSGALVGFDIDVGNAMCAKMKVKCVWV